MLLYSIEEPCKGEKTADYHNFVYLEVHTETVLHTICFTNSCLLRILDKMFTDNCMLKVPRRVHPTGFERLQRHQLSEATRLSEAECRFLSRVEGRG